MGLVAHKVGGYSVLIGYMFDMFYNRHVYCGVFPSTIPGLASMLVSYLHLSELTRNGLQKSQFLEDFSLLFGC